MTILYAHLVGESYGDNYIASFHENSDAFKFSLHDDDRVVAFNVPDNMVEDLLTYGTTENKCVYHDGYDAYRQLRQYRQY